ncbi:hypothetical protein V2O64_19485 [Verrucomicrobiaceae bacterium 227]
MNGIFQNWKGLVVGFLLLVSVGLAVHQTTIYFRYFEWSEALKPQTKLWANQKPLLGALSEEADVFLFSQWDTERQSEDHEAILRVFPDDPAIYSRYCSEGWLPKDFRETVARIDPDNGWFDELEANRIIEKARKAGKDEPLEEDQLEKAMNLLYQAVSKGRSESYSRELIERGAELIPDGDDVQSRRWHLYGGFYGAPGGSATHFIWRAIGEEAQSLVEGQEDEFRRLIAMSNTLIERRMRSVVDTVDVLVVASSMESLRGEFAKTAQRLGMEDEATIYEEGAASMRELRESWKNVDSGRKDYLDERSPGHLMMLSSGGDRFLSHPFALEELEAGVNAEHAHIAWRNSLQGFYIFGVISLGLVVSIYRGRKEHVGAGWKLIVFGCLVPFAAFFALREWTTLGQLQSGPQWWGIYYNIGLWIGLAVALILSPLAVAWIISRKGAQIMTPRAMLPAFLCSVMIFGCLSKVFYLQEKSWVARDELGSRGGIYPTKVEAMIFESLRSEVGKRYHEIVARETEGGFR